MTRQCNREWFKLFDLICYAPKCDGLFCLAFVPFPVTAHRRARKLISEPYQNWKDALDDLKNHATLDYHITSMTKMRNFKLTYEDPSKRIEFKLTEDKSKVFTRNRNVLLSVLKCLELCGRQGLALRGHRDDEASSALNKGNFKALINFRADAGDMVLQHHLQLCKKMQHTFPRHHKMICYCA